MRDFWWRAQIRFLILRVGALSGLIWVAALIGGAWLRHVGFGALVPWLFLVWVLAALPMMYLDLALILDMVGYTFTGHVTFFPTLLAYRKAATLEERNALSAALAPQGMEPQDLTAADEAQLDAMMQSPWARGLLRFLDASSPFACLAMWSLVVLSRIPTSAHRLLVASKARAMKLEVDRSIYDQTLSRFAA